MKRKLVTMMLFMALFSLTACQSQNMSTADKYWKSARKADNLKAYVEKQADSFDIAVLKQEASSADSTLSQQFHAISLLCELDRQGGEDATSYAEGFLAKVNTEGDEFWAALETSFSPYDCFYALLETTDQIDGNTLANLISGIPIDSEFENGLRIAVDNWVKAHPGKMLTYIDDLKAVGFFDEWKIDEWKSAYFYDSNNPYSIETDTTEDAIAYISYIRDSLLPELHEKDLNQSLQKVSEFIEDHYYSTNLAVTVNDTLELKEPDENNLPEAIELDGKKVLAFYHNPYTQEFEGSPTNLRVLGDFMLGLPKEEYPKSLDEADYYLVLTPSYKYYETDKGVTDETKMISTTSIDLYEAKTGAFLKNLGYLPEENFADKNAGSYGSPAYPDLINADILYFIYHNANTPEEYASMLVNRYGKEEFKMEEPVTLGGWEITCHSCEIVDSFIDGMYIYEPDAGYQFARLRLTVTNVSDKKNTFLPFMYYIGSDTLVQITDSSFENFYDTVNILNLDTCLADTSLESGESAEGELDIQLPKELVEGTNSLFIVISLGEQNAVFCPIEDNGDN